MGRSNKDAKHTCQLTKRENLTVRQVPPILNPSMSLKTIAQRLAAGIWLALLLSVGITADLIVDLVFEESDVVAASMDSPVSEAPDNAAEHLLRPSLNALDMETATTQSVPLEFTALLAVPQPAPISATVHVASPSVQPPGSCPSSFLCPLRI